MSSALLPLEHAPRALEIPGSAHRRKPGATRRRCRMRWAAAPPCSPRWEPTSAPTSRGLAATAGIALGRVRAGHTVLVAR